MKARKRLAPKYIVMAIALVALLAATVTGVTLFLKDDGEVSATQDGNLPSDINSSTTQSGETQNGNEQADGESSQINEGNEQTEPGETTNQESGDTEGDNITEGTTGSTTSGTTSTGTTQGRNPTRDEILNNIKETVVLEDKKVYEGLSLSWTTIKLSTLTTDIGVYKPELTIEKTAVLVNGEEITTNTTVREGDKITYEIKVSNLGNYKATNLVITDSRNVEFDKNAVEAGKTIVELEVLEPGKQATIYVTYEVTKNDVKLEDNVLNIAYVTDGSKTLEDDDNTIAINPNVKIAATKVWKNDAENLRPESITVQLLADGEVVEGKTLELNANNNWTAEFTDLQKYQDLTRTEIVYSVEEVEVPEGYTSKVEGMTITNIYEEPTVSKTATKVWEADSENLRPESITVQLLADDEVVEGKTLELNATNNWTAEFTDLQKYHNLTRTEIEYSVEEVEVPEGYTSAVEGMTITNTYEEPTTSKTATKVWVGDAENLRPASITVQLLADGEVVEGKTLELNANNNWTAEFTDLQKYQDLTRTEIVYSVEEVEVPEGYTSKVEGMTITNIYEEPTVSKTATKVWEADSENLRPASITVQLLADGEVVEGKILELNANNNWTAEFTALQKYQDLTRTEIVYSVEEVEVPEGYTSKVEGMTITNIYEEPTVSKTVTKVWVGDAENLRSESITIQLLADGEVVEGKTLELNANNNWTAEFTELQKYKDLTRTEIVYSVEEVEVPEGYTSAVEGMTITNTYEEPTTSKTATKVWEGDNANLRPGSITVQLLADGKAVEGKTLELNATNNWTAKFTELQKYKDLTRTEIEYSVEEVNVPEGYTSAVEGMTITNTYEEPTTSKTATKVWVGDAENLRPASITVQLLADGKAVEGKTLELNANNNWTAKFTELQKYKDLTRTEIVYSVEEVEVPEGYTSTVEGMTITNTYEEPTISKTATKVWVGDNANLRPASITAQLLADGKAVEGKTLELNANNNWTAKFTELQKYKDLTRTEIEYSVEEVNVPEGYTSTVKGMTITNTYTEPTIAISVIKKWEGKKENTLLRKPITVDILDDNGNKVERVILTQDKQWVDSVSNLQKYKTGTRTLINYQVKEITKLEGYKTTYGVIKNNDGIITELIVTNAYEEPTVNKTAVKTWNGEDDSKVRPTSIEVQLYKDEGNGPVKVEGKTATLTANGGWKAEFTKLPKYVEGTIKQIEYSIVETTVLPEGYNCEQDKEDPMHIINTYKEPKVFASAEKAWNHNNNSAEKRPTSVVIRLLADGKDTGKTKTLSSANSWKATFDNLNKYDYSNGQRKLITYTVQEEDVPNQYEESIENLGDRNFKVTNTYKPLTYKKESASNGKTINLGDNITYKITIGNPNNKNSATATFKDTVPENTELNGVIKVTTTGGTTNNPTTLTEKQMKDGYVLTVPGKGTVVVEFTVKTLKSALGTAITNTAQVNDNDTETISTTVEKGMNIYQVESSKEGQKTIIVIDMSLSMASAVNSSDITLPSTETGNDRVSDYLAYSYSQTRWKALKDALDAFVDDYFDSNSKNELYIYGYNNKGIKLMEDFAKTKEAAKNAYKNVFTEEHYKNVVEAAKSGKEKYESQFDVSFANPWHKTDDGNYNIDVDALRYLSQGKWHKDSSKNSITAGTKISKNAVIVDYPCKLAGGTDIAEGLKGANEMISGLSVTSNVSVVVMADGRDDDDGVNVKPESKKIYDKEIDLYTVAFTSEGSYLSTHVGTEYITKAESTTSAENLKVIFENMADVISEKDKIYKETTTKYIDMSDITIPADTATTTTTIKIFTGTRNNPNVIETYSSADFKKDMLDANKKFNLTAFLTRNSSVSATDTINIEIYTKVK